MRYLIGSAILTAGVSIGVTNPARHECVAVTYEEERTDPTVMNAEGELVAVEFVINCGAEGGDDLFTLRIEAEDEEMAPAVEAVATVVTYTPGAP